jgi:hypothetical protein
MLKEMPFPIPPDSNHTAALAIAAAALNCGHEVFSPYWLKLRPLLEARPWSHWWALSRHERLRRRAQLDAAIAELFGLDWRSFAWILKDCDHPISDANDAAKARRFDPKGFWRAEKDVQPELRHSVMSLVAFAELKKMVADSDRDRAIKEFFNGNDGYGWQLPESLRLADYGLGHDERAQVLQPVLSRLGPRLLARQTDQGSEQSWSDCERHALNLLGADDYARLQEELTQSGSGAERSSPSSTAKVQKAGSGQRRLFPDESTTLGDKTEDPV